MPSLGVSPGPRSEVRGGEAAARGFCHAAAYLPPEWPAGPMAAVPG
jgi:hypothetical protein